MWKGRAGEEMPVHGEGRGIGGVEAVAVRRQLSASSRKKYVHNQFKPDPR